MTLAALLARRPWVSDRTLLDCLELAEWLAPFMGGPEPPRITSSQLEARWNCTQSTVSRRVSALMEHGLIDATLQAGPGAYWAVKRVGPVA